MNPESFQNLADHLSDNPSYFEDMDDSLLGDLIFHYHEGELPEAESAEVAALIATNPKAKVIHQRILEAGRYAASEPGKAWMESLPDRVMTETPAPSAQRQEFSPNIGFGGRIRNFLKDLRDRLSPTPTALMAHSSIEPITGFCGPHQEVFYAMTPNAEGLTELALYTSVAAWKNLRIKLGSQENRVDLSETGEAWGGLLPLDIPFSTLDKAVPIIEPVQE